MKLTLKHAIAAIILALKNVGWVLLGIATLFALVFVAALLINGTAWVSGHVLEYLIPLNNILAVACIVVLLPLALFQKTRIVPAYGLYVASFVFGVCVWLYGFIVTYAIWGGGGVFIGLILGIVGIVPLGIIAAAWHSEWGIVASLIFGLILTYGARAIALWLWAKIEQDEKEKPARADTIDQQAPEPREPAKSVLSDTGTGTSRAKILTAVWLGPVLFGLVFVWLFTEQRTLMFDYLAGRTLDPFRAAGYKVEDPPYFAAVNSGDYAEALRLIRPLANQVDAVAQDTLGDMYLYDNGVAQNYAEAMRLYRKAADQGNVYSQNSLGDIYFNGNGLPQNYAEAMKWYRKAADQGYPSSQNSLGSMYFNGDGVPQDYAEAAKWYRLAAERGFIYAQYNLGNMYFNGTGVPQDYVRAHMWLNLSAAQGDKDAATQRAGVMLVMTPEQIAEAQKLSRDWKPTKRSR